MSDADDFQELSEVRRQIKELMAREDRIIDRIEKKARFSSKSIEFKFSSQIAAIEHILRKAKIPLHSEQIVAELIQLGFPSATTTSVSGMLRRYSSEGRIFEAMGGNKFTVLQN